MARSPRHILPTPSKIEILDGELKVPTVVLCDVPSWAPFVQTLRKSVKKAVQQ